MKRNKRAIHLTSLSKNFEDKNDDIYAGKWCKPFLEEKNIVNHNKQFKNLQGFQNNLTKYLIRELNEYHKEKYDKKFWKFILDEWIRSFTYILYDRFCVLRKLNKLPNIKYFLVLKNSPQNTTYENLVDYEKNIKSDYFNNSIFGDLLKLEKKNKIRYFYIKQKKKIEKKFRSKLSISIKNKLSVFSNKKIIFFDTNLSVKKFYKFHLKYHFFNSLNEVLPDTKIDLNFRNQNYNLKKKNISFQEILNFLSLKYLPKAYLENFKIHLSKKYFKKFHSFPDKVFTLHSHKSNDQFKIWFAQIKIKSKKTKLISIQYGSNYLHKEEASLYDKSDLRLNWGKFNISKRDQYTGIPPNFDEKLKKENLNKILYICNEQPIYRIKNVSSPQGPDFEKHILLQETFFKKLDKKIIKKIDIKSYFFNYGWNVNKRLKNINKKFNIIKNKHIDKCFSEYDLIICGWPSTTLLESISLNIPTISLFSIKDQNYNSKAKKIYEKLKKINVIFENPKKASNYLNNYSDNLLNDWYNINTQKILSQFRENVATRGINYKDDLEKIIKNFK